MSKLTSQYSIKDLETLTGIKAHTIRMWEKRYNIPCPKRTNTNIRYYDDDELKRLLNVSVMLESGKRISYVSKLSNDELRNEIKQLLIKDGGEGSDLLNKNRINGLLSAMIDVDELRFVTIFDACLADVGFKQTIIQLIYPFLEKVGIMWGINEINPAQEHFVSNLIRRKMEREIDRLPFAGSDADMYLLFLPENELHELGLLIAQYILRFEGKRTVYLGQNVPYNDMLNVAHRIDPQYIITFFVSPLPAKDIEGYLSLIENDLPQTSLFVSGPDHVMDKVKLPENTKRLSGTDELEHHIHS